MKGALMKTALGLIMIAIVTALASVGEAIEEKPLPAFVVRASDGQIAPSSSFVREGRWVLILAQQPCRPCDAVLGSVNKSEHPNVPSRMVVVLAGVDASGLAAQAGRFRDLDEAQWYADPDGVAYSQLMATPGVAIFGMRAGTIEWSLNGALSDSPDVRSILSQWIEAP